MIGALLPSLSSVLLVAELSLCPLGQIAVDVHKGIICEHRVCAVKLKCKGTHCEPRDCSVCFQQTTLACLTKPEYDKAQQP